MSAASHISTDFECSFETSIETRDHQDHTFNGIYFELSANADEVPLRFVRVDSLSVRGALGPMTVWATDGGLGGRAFSKRCAVGLWRKLFDGHVPPSFRRPVPLRLEEPVIVYPGRTVGLYVHSARRSDDGIVYDNRRGRIHTYRDSIMTVHPGYAHISPVPFHSRGPWGTAFRSDRAFVGRIDYGASLLLWTPSAHRRFPPRFRESCSAMHRVHACSWDGLPAEVVLYVLNFCPADWFDPPPGKRASSKSVLSRVGLKKGDAPSPSSSDGARGGKSSAAVAAPGVCLTHRPAAEQAGAATSPGLGQETSSSGALDALHTVTTIDNALVMPAMNRQDGAHCGCIVS